MAHHLGSCLCAQVKFKVEGELESFYLCHCSYCQKDTGSAHASNLFSSKAKLTWITGQEFIVNYNHAGTRHAKSFCQNCGSALPRGADDGTLELLPAGSLDTDIEIRPAAHIFTASCANWDVKLEEIKQFESFPN